MNNTKICSACKKEKDITAFWKCKTNKDGLQTKCKECNFQYHKKYYARPEIKEKMRLYQKKLRQADPERFRARDRKRYHTNPSRNRAYQSKYLKKRSDKLRELVFQKLGNVCKRCGFSDKRALQIDHVNEDGTNDRKGRNQFSIMNEALKNTTGKYQILCCNCNWIKRVEAKMDQKNRKFKL